MAVVEAAYEPEPTDEAWIDGVLAASQPMLDHGEGVAGFTFAVERGKVTVGSAVELNTSDGFGPKYTPIFAQAAYLGAPGLKMYRALFSEAAGAEEPRGSTMVGLSDFLALHALDPCGRGVAIVAPLPPGTGPIDPAQDRWLRVASHMSSGLRLRRALCGWTADASDFPLGGEAVLDPSARIVDAVGPATQPDAREALRTAARRADRARGRLRTDDAEEALRIWSGLIDGRWSLVDWYDADGRRFLVARRNDPHVTDPRALTSRERQVARYAALGHTSKHIAYELGLAPSTIATHLSSAMRKLGAATLADLILTMRRLDRTPPPE
jgi:DNA-binding CsgD family transcriptional regulator